MNQRGDRLVKSLLGGGNDISANNLLNELFNGYSIENLRQLLTSADENVVRTGTWLASELGERASSILDDVAPLLRHKSRYVRFFVLDVVLTCASEGHGEIIAAAITLLLDADSSVRWKALSFLAKLSQNQLVSSVPYQNNKQIKDLTVWLAELNPMDEAFTPDVSSRLNENDPIIGFFAAVAAVRFSSLKPILLKHAADSTNLEIVSFVSDYVKKETPSSRPRNGH